MLTTGAFKAIRVLVEIFPLCSPSKKKKQETEPSWEEEAGLSMSDPATTQASGAAGLRFPTHIKRNWEDASRPKR